MTLQIRARVTVFCGARVGRDPRHASAASALGRGLAERGVSVVYGAGGTGLMGILADAALGAGGEVIGVIPESLATHERLHRGLSATHVVADMHARKALMASLGDAFVALPGGFGTLEELFEVVTWAQLELHRKPAFAVNVARYYAPLATLIDAAVVEGYVTPAEQGAVRLVASVRELFDQLAEPLASARASKLGAGSE